MKKNLLIIISLVVLSQTSIKADVVVDSLSRMTFTSVLNEMNEPSPLTGIELKYYNKSNLSFTPFRIFQYNSATWLKWTQPLSSRSFSIAGNGMISMGDFNENTIYTNSSPRILTLHNSSGIGLHIEQNNTNAAINVNVNNGGYIIKGNAPRWGAGNNSGITEIVFSVNANGIIYSANSQLTLSDENHKRDIQSVTNVSAALREVNPVSYVLTSNDSEETTSQVRTRRNVSENSCDGNAFIPDTVVNEEIDPAVKTALEQQDNRPKYGFVAQEIEEIFPNVVYTLPNGEKAIAYQEIIPLLVSAFQEQQNIIDSLTVRIEEIENSSVQQRQQAPAAMEEAIADGTAALMQNTPNPFNQATEIGYRLPEGTATALIMACDMNGKMLQTYPLAVNATDGTLTLQAGSYTPGMYLYTLLVDGVQIDTKQMIILAH